MNTVITSAAGNASLTMSSREIAEICAARHNDVVETIERLFAQGVLRESRKTTRTHRPEGGGRPTEVYDLTKRDTLVVVSGYNAEVRAKIIDRWMELEGAPDNRATPKPKRIRKPAFDTAFTRCMKVVAHLPNVDENQKVLMAARGTQNLCGINPLEVMGYTALPAQTEDNYKTPTELGKELGLSGRRVNQILSEEAHLQIYEPGSSTGSDWAMTERGLAYGKMFDTTRRGGKGSQQQLKWKPSVVEFLRPFAAPSA